MSAKGPAPGLWLGWLKGFVCSWMPTAAVGSSRCREGTAQGRGDPRKGRRRLEREAQWLGSLFLSPPGADCSLSQPARTSLAQTIP